MDDRRPPAVPHSPAIRYRTVRVCAARLAKPPARGHSPAVMPALSLDTHQLVMELIQDFDLDALARRQTAALEAQGLPLPS